ncbi:MAG: hypothetical protein ACKO0W_02010, partial [Planctomycetota bacterium]
MTLRRNIAVRNHPLGSERAAFGIVGRGGCEAGRVLSENSAARRHTRSFQPFHRNHPFEVEPVQRDPHRAARANQETPMPRILATLP